MFTSKWCLIVYSSESTEYSDWAPDSAANLQPPKRRSQRQIKRREWKTLLAESGNDSDETVIDGQNSQHMDVESDDEVASRRKRVSRVKKKNIPLKKQVSVMLLQLKIGAMLNGLYWQLTRWILHTARYADMFVKCNAEPKLHGLLLHIMYTDHLCFTLSAGIICCICLEAETR